MKEIDQSGKVEDLSKNTILAISNGDWQAVIIKSADKKKLKNYFNKWNMPRDFVLLVFCAGLSYVIDNCLSCELVIIDEEYTGKNHIIKNLLIEMGNKLPNIRFGQIGKKSNAHYRAYGVATHKIKYDKKVKVLTLEQIWKKIKKTKVVSRLSNA